ncbi:MAG: STAS domain-containing protein [Kibdelosporangium sp.]
MSINTHFRTPIVAVQVSRADDVVVVHVAGEVDMSSVEPLETAIRAGLRDHPTGLVVNMTDVSFCGSSGLRILLEARELAESTGTSLSLVARGPAVLRTLEISGLSELFRIHSSVSEALMTHPA